MKTLWARRFDSAYGWRWHAQRQVTAQTAEDWLAVFRKDEPEITFIVAARKPR